MGENSLDFENPYRAPEADLSAPIVDYGLEGTTPPVEGVPVVTIWTRPRGTIRDILNHDPNQALTTLICLYGITNALVRQLFSSSEPKGWFFILPGALIFGPIGAGVGIHISEFLLSWAGGWVGGKATHAEAMAAIAWGAVPQITSALIVLSVWGVLAISGVQVIEVPLVISLLRIVQVVLGLWYAVISLRCMAEAHRIGSWKMLFAEILLGIAILAILTPLFLGLSSVRQV